MLFLVYKLYILYIYSYICRIYTAYAMKGVACSHEPKTCVCTCARSHVYPRLTFFYKDNLQSGNVSSNNFPIVIFKGIVFHALTCFE